ncbi:MAG: hypothetical protein QOE47_2685, partial [Pyrinomonadaceae bacterium]|nr:hypothetical protein [Pyrinomonadaceae bacterium]
MDDTSATFVVIVIVLFVVAIGVIFRRRLKDGSTNSATDNYSILPHHDTLHSGGTGDSGGFSDVASHGSDYTSSDSYSSSDFGGHSAGGDFSGGDFSGGGSGGDFGGDSSGGDSGGGDSGGGGDGGSS